MFFQPSEDSGTRLVSPVVLFAPLGFSVEKEEEPRLQDPLPPASAKAHLAPPYNLDHRQKVLGQRRELLWEGQVLRGNG